MQQQKYTGQLYQLYSDRACHAGAYVAVNGPWDTFGVVLKSTPQEDGRYLNLIRGTAPRPGEKPVMQF